MEIAIISVSCLFLWWKLSEAFEDIKIIKNQVAQNKVTLEMIQSNVDYTMDNVIMREPKDKDELLDEFIG